jgi:hypothetical protein
MRITATLHLTSPLLTQPGSLRDALAKVVSETAFEVEADIKERMRAPKTGRTYRRGVLTRKSSKATRSLGLRERTSKGGARLAIVGSKLHRASAPGEAPAVDHGALINSVRAVPDGLHATIFSSVVYAAALEHGVFYSRLKGRRVVKIEPRPSFEPALEAARPRFVERCDAAIKELL